MVGRPPKAPKVELTCQQCGKKWLRYPWVKDEGKYCSRACYYKSMVGKGMPIIKPEPRICPECKNEFWVGGVGYRKFNSTYCSRQCSAKHRWLHFPGHERAREMSDVERAWMACLLDAEGSIVWPRKTVLNSVRLSVANTSLPFLEHARQVTGTGKILERTAPSSPFHTRGYNWHCYGENARIILRQVLPWLIIKKEAAEVALGIVQATEPPLTQRTKTMRLAMSALKSGE